MAAARSLNRLTDSVVASGLFATTNDGSLGALSRMESIASEGMASLKIPMPPRITVFFDPRGEYAKPIFGSYTTPVTEGNAVCCPVEIAWLTGAAGFN